MDYIYENLLHAVGRKDYVFIEACLANGVNFSSMKDRTLDFAYDDIKMVKKLFDLGLTIKSKNWMGFLLACEEGNYEVVEYLLSKVDNKYIPDDFLERACMGGNKAIVELFLNKKMATINEESFVYQAAHSKSTDMLKYVLEKYSENNDITKLDGLMGSCIEFGYVDMVGVLFEKGFTINFNNQTLARLISKSDGLDMFRCIYQKKEVLNKEAIGYLCAFNPVFKDYVLSINESVLLREDLSKTSPLDVIPKKLKV